MLYTIQHYREAVMPIRLNVTVDKDVYVRLKKELPPKKISAFINEAVRARLHPDRQTLDAAYRAASRGGWRRRRAPRGAPGARRRGPAGGRADAAPPPRALRRRRRGRRPRPERPRPASPRSAP